MDKILLYTIISTVTFSCNNEIYTDVQSRKKENYTDSILLPESNLFVRLNSYGLFDTSYITLRGDMCSAPTRSYTFSNSEYACIDTFQVMQKLEPTDSMLYMEVFESEIEFDTRIDSDYLEQKKAQHIAHEKALKSGAMIVVDNVIEKYGVRYCYFSYTKESKPLHSQTSLKAFAIINSQLLTAHFVCRAQDCVGKSETFEKILSSTMITKQ